MCTSFCSLYSKRRVENNLYLWITLKPSLNLQKRILWFFISLSGYKLMRENKHCKQSHLLNKIMFRILLKIGKVAISIFESKHTIQHIIFVKQILSRIFLAGLWQIYFLEGEGLLLSEFKLYSLLCQIFQFDFSLNIFFFCHDEKISKYF